MRKLNQIGLVSELLKISFKNLTEYQNKLEEFILETKNSVDNDFSEIEKIKAENEEYYYMLEDTYSKKYHNYDKYYPNRLRSALILQTYSTMEFYLKKICDIICWSNKLKFEVSEIKATGDLDRIKKYLKKTTNIDFNTLNPEWKHINQIRLLRNQIVHNDGHFEIISEQNKNDMVDIIKNNESLGVLENEEKFTENKIGTYEIYLKSQKLNIDFMKDIETIFKKLQNIKFKE